MKHSLYIAAIIKDTAFHDVTKFLKDKSIIQPTKTVVFTTNYYIKSTSY